MPRHFVTDSQRSKVYTAENAALPMHVNMLTWDECQDWLNRAIASDHYTEHKGWKRIVLEPARGGRSTWWFTKKRILLGKNHRNPYVILHELSHALADRTHGRATASHGSFFCGHYLMLVREMCGVGDFYRLKIAFDERGVRYCKKIVDSPVNND